MKSIYRPQWDDTPLERLQKRAAAVDSVRVRGVGKTPDPPRDLQAQPGNSKVMITWKRPATPVSAYRIYRDTENNLVLAVQDAGTLLAEIPSSAGATPTVTSFFVSAVNAFGNESAKVQVVSSAKTDATAPSDPPPPPDTPPPSGGGGTGDDPCFSGNVPLKTPSTDKRFDELPEYPIVLNRRGEPRRYKLLKRYFKGMMLDMGGGELVTKQHKFSRDGAWIPASEIFTKEEPFEGTVYNLMMLDEEDFDEQHYALTNGRIAHNSRAIDQC